DDEANESEDLETAIQKLRKVCTIIEKNFKRLELFNKARLQFMDVRMMIIIRIIVKECEKETKELSQKLREFERKKLEFKRKMAEEQEENMRKIKLEYERLEEQKRIWAHEKRRIDVERESLTSDYHRIIQEKNFYSEGARKEYEK